MRALVHRFDDYDFQLWVATQAQVHPSRVHRMLASFGHDEVNDWFAARSERNELAGYVGDLQIAYELAQRGPPDQTAEDTVELQARYALLYGTLREVAANMPPNLARRLVEAGYYTAAQATTWARLNPDPSGASQMLVEVLRAAGTAAHLELWMEALQIGGRIQDADGKVLGVVRIASDLPPALQLAMLDVIENEPNEGSQGGALQELMQSGALLERTFARAWKIACQMKQPELRAEAMAYVGARLSDERRQQALRAYIDHNLSRFKQDSAEALTYHVRECATIAVLATFPTPLLLDLQHEKADPAWQNLFAAVLIEQRVQTDPLGAAAALAVEPRPVSRLVWGRVATALAGAGRYAEATTCLEQLGEYSNELHEALADILASAPLHMNATFLSAYRKLGTQQKVGVLRRVLDTGKASEGVLRAMAAPGQSRSNDAELQSLIAGVLSDDEVAELLSRELDNDWNRLTIRNNLAYRLSAQQIKDLLAQGQTPFGSVSPAPLLLRLMQLDGPDSALPHLAKDTDWNDTRKLIAELVPDWPAAGLPALLNSIRPNDVRRATAALRARLLPHLPRATAAAFFTDSLPQLDPADRLTILQDVLTLEQSPESYRLAVDLLVVTLSQCWRGTDSPYMREKIEKALGVLAQQKAAIFAVPVAERIAELLSESNVLVKFQARWLAILGTGDPNSPGCKAALRAAYALCLRESDEESFQFVGDALGTTVCVALDQVAQDVPDGEMLAVFAITAADALTPEAISHLVDRLESCADLTARWNATAALVSVANPRLRLHIVENALRRSDWQSHPLLSVCWMALIDATVPGKVQPHEIVGRFEQLPAAQKLVAAAISGQAYDERNVLTEPALTCLHDLTDDEQKRDLLSNLADHLHVGEIESALDLALWDDANAEDALTALAFSALRQNAWHTALRCINSCSAALRENAVFRALIDALPLEALRWYARPHLQTDQEWRLSPGDWCELAARAAELGDADLVRRFLEARGGSYTSGDKPIREIFGTTDRHTFDDMLTVAQQLRTTEKIEAVATLLAKFPQRATKSLIAGLLDDLLDSYFPSDERFAKLLRPVLARMSAVDLLELYTKALNAASRERRALVLDYLLLFAPALISVVGPSIAPALDRACSIGCRSRWP